MSTLTYTTKFYIQTCINCGVLFGVPDRLDDELRENRHWFYCPNGHAQQYIGKTKEQEQRERADRAERQAAQERARRDQAEAEARHQEARANGYKGVATKARKRAAKGVCPAPGCKRSFVDVARHVSTCHPDYDSTVSDA